jgi:hypothetical protein
VEKDWIGILMGKERYCHKTGEFIKQFEMEKMIHIVSDGEARPNTAPAGWAALIGQNMTFE